MNLASALDDRYRPACLYTTMVNTTSNTPQPRLHCTKCGAVELAGSGVTLTTCGEKNIGDRRPAHDSERQAECTTATYCSLACKNAHAVAHSRFCGWKLLHCRDEDAFNSDLPFSAINAGWSGMNETSTSSSEKAERLACPSTALIGLPLSLKLSQSGSYKTLLKPMTMPISDLLMIDPDTGYFSAPTLWRNELPMFYQLEVGRQDGKPLTSETFEVVLEFLASIAQDMSNTSPQRGWFPLREYLTPQAFQHFSRRYFREQRVKGRDGFDGPFAPL